MTDMDDDLRLKMAEIDRRLAAAYGEPERPQHLRSGFAVGGDDPEPEHQRPEPGSGLRTPAGATAHLGPGPRRRCRTLVIDAIRPAGLANQKGPHIQEALRTITRERGELSLDFLADWPVDRAKAWLSSIKGVGPKTAAIVLLFGLDRPAFPVDTHVHRVTRRLGLIGPVSREKAHDDLEKLVPPESYYAFHLNLIRHGRQVCASRRPNCQVCTLRDLCCYYQEQQHGQMDKRSVQHAETAESG